MFRSLKKHEILLEEELVSLIRTLISIGREVMGLDITENPSISVIFDDSIIEDKNSSRKADLELVKEGIISPWEFRMKHFGEDEATAKSKIRKE